MLRVTALSRPLGAAILALLITAAPASAQTNYFWNAPNGGIGNWDTATTNWATMSIGRG